MPKYYVEVEHLSSKVSTYLVEASTVEDVYDQQETWSYLSPVSEEYSSNLGEDEIISVEEIEEEEETCNSFK